MKILVPVKRVIDANIRARIKADGSDVELQNVKMSANPFDEIALEEAVRLKEAGNAEEIIVISIGPPSCQETLRSALAIGADRAILVQTHQIVQPLTVAKLLKLFVEKEQPDLVIMGKQAIDDDANQTGQMLAALLNWPQGTFASRIQLQNRQLTVEREIDGGHQTLVLDLPCVVTTDLRLNVPRFAKLPDIMKARQKKLEIISVESLSVDISPRFTVLSVESPAPRKPGVAVHTVDELIDKLRHIEQVIQ